MTPPPDPLVGREIGGVVVEGRLGAGGMAAVYLGRDAQAPPGEERCALKLLSVTSHAHYRARFEREAQIGERLQSALLVRVRRSGVSGDYHYMVMELVEGEDLHHVLERHGRQLPWPSVAGLGRDLGRALEALHAEGVVHRDLKPANVLLDGRGGLKLADFGLARWTGAPAELPTEVPLTATGDAFGTPAYMAPEQFEDAKTARAAADLYALGVLLYEAVSGRLPFVAELPVQQARMHLEEEAPALACEAPDELRALIEALLAKRPAERPSATQVVEVCRELIKAAPTAEIELQAPPGSRFTRWNPQQTPHGLREGTSATAPPPASTRPPAHAQGRRSPWLLLVLPLLLGALLLAWRSASVRALLASERERSRYAEVEAAVAQLSSGGPAALEDAIQRYRQDVPGGLLAGEVEALWSRPLPLRGSLHVVVADGAHLAKIPAGRYQVGEESPSSGEPNLEPRREVTLGSFWIDRDEVSRARYERFLVSWKRAGGSHACGDPHRDHEVPLGSALCQDPAAPIVGVSYFDALEYARFYGRRLPTPEEWAVAAAWDPTGGEPRPYPWGKKDPRQMVPFPANLAFAGYGITDDDTGDFQPLVAPAGTFEFDRSAFGLRDVVGNAAEWCAGEDPPPAPQPIRGGCLITASARGALLHAIGSAPPDRPPQEVGFRTALTAQE